MNLRINRKYRRPRWISEATTLHFRRCRVKIKLIFKILKQVKNRVLQTVLSEMEAAIEVDQLKVQKTLTEETRRFI